MRRVSILLVAAFALSACSGGGQSSLVPSKISPNIPGGLSGTNPISDEKSTIVLTANVPNIALPALFAKAKNARSAALRRRLASSSRRDASSLSLSSVKVVGIFYPGYAGSQPITNSVSYTPGESLSNVTIPFSNVPTGNNEWATFDFQGIAADGSSIDIGQLAGIFNVSGSSATGTLSITSTIEFQLAETLAYDGILSLDDLENQTTLASDLGKYSNSQPTDANTGLLSNQTLAALETTLSTVYSRTLVISSSAAASSTMTIAPDYSQPTLRNLVSNIEETYEFYSPGDTPTPANGFAAEVYGNPLNDLEANSPPHSPYNPTQNAAASFEAAETVPAPTGSVTVANVYGGPILVGTYPNDGSFRGAAVGVGNRNPGSSTSTSLTLQATSTTLTIADAQSATFAQDAVLYPTFYLDPISAYNASQVPGFDFEDYETSPAQNQYVAGSANGSTYQVEIDTFSPFGIGLSQEELCGPVNCVTPSTSGSNAIPQVYDDPATDLAFYNYTPQGAITAITSDAVGDYASCGDVSGSVPCGYLIKMTGTSGDIVTNKTTYFGPQQTVYITSYPMLDGSTENDTTVFPDGTDVRVQLTCNGVTYHNDDIVGSNSDSYDAPGTGEASVTMYSLPANETCQSTAIGIVLPAAVSGQTFRITGLVPNGPNIEFIKSAAAKRAASNVKQLRSISKTI